MVIVRGEGFDAGDVTVLDGEEGMFYGTVRADESSRRYGADHCCLSSCAQTGRRASVNHVRNTAAYSREEDFLPGIRRD